MIKHKKNSVINRGVDFCIRRLMRVGKVKRGDIIDATGISTVSASKVLSLINKESFITKKGDLLILDGFIDKKHYWHSVSNDEQLMYALDNGCSFEETGLKLSELNVTIKSLSSKSKIKQNLLSSIIKSLNQIKVNHKSALDITYISLKEGSCGEVKRIVPIGLERLADQWRVIAHDLMSPQYPIKTYVLSRIIDFNFVTDDLPRSFKKRSPYSTKKIMEIKFNPRLTKEQIGVFKNKLGINENNILEIDSRLEFELLQRFGEIKKSSNAVWPIIISIGDKKCM